MVIKKSKNLYVHFLENPGQTLIYILHIHPLTLNRKWKKNWTDIVQKLHITFKNFINNSFREQAGYYPEFWSSQHFECFGKICWSTLISYKSRELLYDLDLFANQYLVKFNCQLYVKHSFFFSLSIKLIKNYGLNVENKHRRSIFLVWVFKNLISISW